MTIKIDYDIKKTKLSRKIRIEVYLSIATARAGLRGWGAPGLKPKGALLRR